VWAAVDRYIFSCLEHFRGLVIPGFARITWQVEHRFRRDSTELYFELLEPFCRTFHVANSRRYAAPLEADLAACEDFNYSKAALRFSRKLKKDHVVAGLRVLVIRMGEAMAQGRQMSLDFTIGKLLAREREARFVP
ncbi:unnamed protein product, partial [Symbiodinium sp. CCMP2456]